MYLSQTTWVEAPARPVTYDLGKLLNLFVPPYTHLENRDNDSNFHQGPLRGLNEFSVNHLEIGLGLRQSYAPSPALALLCPLVSRWPDSQSPDCPSSLIRGRKGRTLAFGLPVRSGQALPVTSQPTFCWGPWPPQLSSTPLVLVVFVSVSLVGFPAMSVRSLSDSLALWLFLSMVPVREQLAARVNTPRVPRVSGCPRCRQGCLSRDSGLHGLVPLPQNTLGFQSGLLH